MLFCSGPIMDERDTLDWICFLCFVPAVVIAIWGQRTGGKSLEEIA